LCIMKDPGAAGRPRARARVHGRRTARVVENRGSLAAAVAGCF
jgi:hypothetical protein